MLPVRTRRKSPAIAMRLEAKPREGVEALEPREPGAITPRLDAAKERLEGDVEAAQGALLTGAVGQGEFRAFTSQIGQFLTLVLVAERFAAPLVGVDALFQGGVVETLMGAQQLRQGDALGFRRIEAIGDYALHYNLVIVTKYRRKVLDAAMLRDFEGHARERVDAWGGRLIEINGEPDHIHMLFTLPPKHALADFVNALKTGTSRRLRNDYRERVNRFYSKPVLWSRSYCVISCRGAPLEIIKQYIESQDRPED